MKQQPVRVIIVDDSPTARKVIKAGLKMDHRLQIVGTAADAYEARDLIVKIQPDVITLDLDMPRMSGLDFIDVLMKHWPLPIVVVSSLVDGNQAMSIKALERGAVDVFSKPRSGQTGAVSLGLSAVMHKLAEAVYQASFAKVQPKKKEPVKVLSPLMLKASQKIIMIGASTGGTEAIREVLEAMPKGAPPIVVTQHMPEGFTHSFAQRLDQLCENLEVREAVNGDRLESGLALIAPGNQHMLLKKDAQGYLVEVKGGPAVNRHRPSVDVLFFSGAEVAGRNAVATILTGMGSDGANGLLTMRQAGASTFAQDEASCVVYGMPKAAVENGAAERSVSLKAMANTLIGAL